MANSGEPPVLEGWLYKRGAGGAFHSYKFKKRWITVHAGVAHYSEKKGSAKKGKVDLTKATQVSLGMGVEFSVKTPGRLWEFSLYNPLAPPSRAEWVKAFRIGMGKMKGSVKNYKTNPEVTLEAQSLESMQDEYFDPLFEGRQKTEELGSKLNASHFDFLKVVGKGAYGKVMMVRYKATNQIFAMKILKKHHLVQRKQVGHTQTERKVLSELSHPFIVSLRFAFQTKSKLYMIFDYFNGGELFFHLKHARKFDEPRARFYGACIASALGHLHGKGIIYRDLKPENILLDDEGFIKITDFGFAKEEMHSENLTKTFCGTPEYLAPELLRVLENGQGYNKSVDWWSFGTLLYEMLTGLPPFYNQNVKLMCDNILYKPLKMQGHLSAAASDLIKQLLRKDPAKRVGNGPDGTAEIHSHPFFREIDWDKLLSRDLPVPFLPQLSGDDDVSYVDREFTQENPKDTFVPDSLLPGGEEHFPGFTLMPESALG